MFEIQFRFSHHAVAVEDQSQRDADRPRHCLLFADQLDVSAAVKLPLVFDDLDAQDQALILSLHVRIVQLPLPLHARLLTDWRGRVTLAVMLIDMHTHTSVHSTDSNLLPMDALERAISRGLDGVVLTEHDVVWPRSKVEQLTEEAGIVVISGVEVTTELGHVLVYGLEALVPRISDAKRLRKHCDDQDALMFLAHPARDPGLRVPKEAMKLFDGVEGLNGCDGPLQNMSARSRGRTRPLPPIGGSDSHALHEVGTAATEFDADIRNLTDLVAELRSGAYRLKEIDP